MKVGEILDAKGSEVFRVRPDTALWGALRAFRTHRVGALVVGRVAEPPAGLLTERDVVDALLTHGVRLLDLKVRDVMSTDVPTCRRDDTVDTVMRVMTVGRTRHVPVIDDARVVGMVSIGDVIKASLDEARLENRVLRDMHAAQR